MIAVNNLDIREDAFEETLAVHFEGVLDAGDVYYVRANAYNHTSWLVG
jgi:hypothetical protein